jgi:hypothetical protein
LLALTNDASTFRPVINKTKQQNHVIKNNKNKQQQETMRDRERERVRDDGDERESKFTRENTYLK